MTKSTITRERLAKIKSWRETYGAGSNVMLPAEEAEELARIALAAMNGEPFAYIIQDKYERERGVEGHLSRSHVSKYVSQEDINEHEITCIPLYRHAQPVPVVSADLLHTAASAIEDLLTNKDRTGAGVWFDLPFRLRSAANEQTAPVVPDDVLDALQKVARIRLDLNDFDGDRRGIADCPCDAEEALIEVVNRRAAMLAAAPQSPGSEPATVPGKWIPVSDRLPFDEIVTLPKPMGGPFLVAYSSGRVDITWFSCWQDAGGRHGKWDTENTTLSIAMKLGKVTHWMPLPAAPQEVKGE
ncbi:TPA: DUF551 domain-containing protein [Klebsiella variicola subsp. variicola]|nr:DUF551 domain-containing protein [Klebsiella variicola subsp. variicola]